MRELIGTRKTSDPAVTISVYRSDLVHCRECRKTVPVGIEVITARKERGPQTVLKHQYFCRVHGIEFESMTHRQLFGGGSVPKSSSGSDSYLRNFSGKR